MPGVDHGHASGRNGREAEEPQHANWTVSAQRAIEMEAGVKPVAPKVTVADAIASFREFKEKRSADTKRKIKLLTDRLQTFLENARSSTSRTLSSRTSPPFARRGPARTQHGVGIRKS
jgi:hypothetical protein